MKRGFTLLEMIIVMVIMGILAGGVIGFVKNAQQNARIQKTEQNMANIGSTLDMFRNRAKRFPTNEEGLKALVSRPSNVRDWRKLLDEVPVDEWGQSIRYKKEGKTITLASNGPDEEPDTDDDIVIVHN